VICSESQFVADSHTTRQICAMRFSFFSVLLQCVAVCCSELQFVAVWCKVLQCVAVCCSVFSHTNFRICCSAILLLYCGVEVCFSRLQCVAACCSVLQRVAVCCSVL